MYIKNKFLRFLLSVFITLLIYYLIILAIDAGGSGNTSFSNVLESMFVFAVFGLFIVGSALLFVTYISYQLLTKKGNRSKRLWRVVKNTLIFLFIMVLLYLAAMYTDIFG